MMKKITKEAAKAWLKENWAYLAAGGAFVGTVVVAVVCALNKTDDMIDPFVIDRAKDDWMDQLNSFHRMQSTGKLLTVHEALECSCLDQYIKDSLRDRGVLTDQLEADICDKFCEEFPEKAAVLDGIEGFWHYQEDAASTEAS